MELTNGIYSTTFVNYSMNNKSLLEEAYEVFWFYFYFELNHECSVPMFVCLAIRDWKLIYSTSKVNWNFMRNQIKHWRMNQTNQLKLVTAVKNNQFSKYLYSDTGRQLKFMHHLNTKRASIYSFHIQIIVHRWKIDWRVSRNGSLVEKPFGILLFWCNKSVVIWQLNANEYLFAK